MWSNDTTVYNTQEPQIWAGCLRDYLFRYTFYFELIFGHCAFRHILFLPNLSWPLMELPPEAGALATGSFGELEGTGARLRGPATHLLTQRRLDSFEKSDLTHLQTHLCDFSAGSEIRSVFKECRRLVLVVLVVLNWLASDKMIFRKKIIEESRIRKFVGGVQR